MVDNLQGSQVLFWDFAVHYCQAMLRTRWYHQCPTTLWLYNVETAHVAMESSSAEW